MIDFSTTNEHYLNDLMELVRAFEQRTNENFSLSVDYAVKGECFEVFLSSDKSEGFSKSYRYRFEPKDDMDVKRLEKRYLKEAIYGTLSFLSGVNLPYGCLTGIRPTKLYTEIGENAEQMFLKEFSVQRNKVDLIKSIVEVQKPIRNVNENEFDVFVFIPFCPTRCAYCSFVSVSIDKQKKLVEPYVELLLKEIEFLKEVVRMRKIKVRAVYVGGGTPTSLPTVLLDSVLSSLRDFGALEFTVEAGRPDTITPTVVRILKNNGVTRISVNPQTFNQKTLDLIGRRHTAEDIERVYKRCKAHFDVNMDLIAMLPGESLDDFKLSVDKAISLSPSNITVHTLYLKKGSELKVGGYKSTDNATAEAMVNYAYEQLSSAGYEPYYMYRQKYTSGNLENVGYSKAGKVCVYNVDIMEEDTSILAAGAAAISKKWTKSRNLIERNANFKEPLEYIKNFDSVIERQRKFWEIES